jgi:hypothetical protein
VSSDDRMISFLQNLKEVLPGSFKLPGMEENWQVSLVFPSNGVQSPLLDSGSEVSSRFPGRCQHLWVEKADSSPL